MTLTQWGMNDVWRCKQFINCLKNKMFSILLEVPFKLILEGLTGGKWTEVHAMAWCTWGNKLKPRPFFLWLYRDMLGHNELINHIPIYGLVSAPFFNGASHDNLGIKQGVPSLTDITYLYYRQTSNISHTLVRNKIAEPTRNCRSVIY